MWCISSFYGSGLYHEINASKCKMNSLSNYSRFFFPFFINASFKLKNQLVEIWFEDDAFIHNQSYQYLINLFCIHKFCFLKVNLTMTSCKTSKKSKFRGCTSSLPCRDKNRQYRLTLRQYNCKYLLTALKIQLNCNLIIFLCFNLFMSFLI